MRAAEVTGRRLKRLRAEGVSVWLRGGRHDDVATGELERLVTEWDLSGLTVTVEDMVEQVDSPGHVRGLTARGQGGAGHREATRRAAAAVTRQACDVFLPSYETSRGRTGLVSVDLPPARTRRQLYDEAVAAWEAVDRPNLLLKVPAGPTTLETVSALVSRGVGVDVVPVFSTDRYEQVFTALCTGFERARTTRRGLRDINTAVSVPLAPIDAWVDAHLREQGLAASRYPMGEAARAHARLVHHLHEQKLSHQWWQSLAADGADPPHLIWTGIEAGAADDGHAPCADHLVAWGVVHALHESALPSITESAVLVGDALSGRHITAHQDVEALYAFGLSYSTLADELEQEWLARHTAHWREFWRRSEELLGRSAPPREP
ncbi:transaldolase family protein [Streptomyces luteireticuli]|uniref:transaldolase family protein n=1 Tax=Streptomyces luteireticuli TaxID=173858 RepID=UPI003558635B